MKYFRRRSGSESDGSSVTKRKKKAKVNSFCKQVKIRFLLLAFFSLRYLRNLEVTLIAQYLGGVRARNQSLVAMKMKKKMEKSQTKRTFSEMICP
jgi:hypothetical protein